MDQNQRIKIVAHDADANEKLFQELIDDPYADAENNFQVEFHKSIIKTQFASVKYEIDDEITKKSVYATYTFVDAKTIFNHARNLMDTIPDEKEKTAFFKMVINCYLENLHNYVQNSFMTSWGNQDVDYFYCSYAQFCKLAVPEIQAIFRGREIVLDIKPSNRIEKARESAKKFVEKVEAKEDEEDPNDGMDSEIIRIFNKANAKARAEAAQKQEELKVQQVPIEHKTDLGILIEDFIRTGNLPEELIEMQNAISNNFQNRCSKP